ncbi:MAG: Gfo/Idh/MocA family oxidoreductase, partial [Lentisphaeria bacterium]|nr:Gfo/Idh/MocA family oxidoreductase [Lentisphaeria bacterium]
WKAMLKKENLDAVNVCTPNGLHKQPVIDALNAGCHVMVEKPLAMNAKEGELMLKAAKKNKKQLIIGFQWRYDAKAQMFRNAEKNGQFGDILFMKAEALRRRGIPNWGVFGRKDLQGGGPLIDIGVHIMEMAHFIMGSPKPVSASGSIYTYMGDKKSATKSMWENWDHKTYTVEDLAIGHIKFDNGAIMQVEASFAGHMKDKWDLSFYGTKGGGNYESGEIYTDQNDHMVTITPDYLPNVDAFKEKMENYVDTCLNGTPNIANGQAGQDIQKMLDAIYKSAETGKEVKIS